MNGFKFEVAGNKIYLVTTIRLWGEEITKRMEITKDFLQTHDEYVAGNLVGCGLFQVVTEE